MRKQVRRNLNLGFIKINLYKNIFPVKEEEKKKQEEENKRNEREKEILENLEKWKKEILPNWDEKKNNGILREFCLKGVPPSLRGIVWPLMIGNKLRISKESFEMLCKKSKEELLKMKEEKNKVETVNLIPVDIGRTFPQLGFFQEGGPSHEQLHNILHAFVCFRPNVGYIQGMSFIAAHLLLQMDPDFAFCCMVNLLDESIFYSFYTFNMVNIRKYCLVFEELLKIHLPTVDKHFEELQIKSDMYLIDWIMTIFTKSLPLEIVGRIWDIYLIEKDSIIYQTALTILSYRKEFLSEGEFEGILKYLNRPSTFQMWENNFFDLMNQIPISPSIIKQSYSKYNLKVAFCK